MTVPAPKMHRRLSCSDYSFPSLALAQRLSLIRLLGFSLVDLGLFLSTSELESDFIADPGATARDLLDNLSRAGLVAADLFLIVGGDDFAPGALNNPDPSRRDQLRLLFELALDVARRINVTSLTLLPGVAFPADGGGAWARSAEELRWRVETARRAGVEIRIEPHLGSIVPTPELVADLVAAVDGLRLSLDPAHFVFQAISAERLQPLMAHTAHAHVSGARPGGVHVRPERSTWDIPGFVSALESHGFAGSYCVEYVPMWKWGADSTDVISATVTTGALLSGLLRPGGPS